MRDILRGTLNWRVRIGGLAIILLVALGLVGTFALADQAREIGDAPRLAPPAPSWPLGTDALSRSLAPRLMEGIQVTFVLSVTAVALTTVVGTFLGLVAGYVGGAADQIIGRAADVLFAFPSLLLALLVSTLLGFGSHAAVASILLITLPLMVRVVRAATLALSAREFVLAAQVCGAKTSRILRVHLLPNVADTLAIQATYACGVAMLLEGSLSFLGLGVQAPGASLGSLVREGTAYLSVAPWLTFAPGTILAIAIFVVNLTGDGLRDVVDPLPTRRLL